MGRVDECKEEMAPYGVRAKGRVGIIRKEAQSFLSGTVEAGDRVSEV